MPMAVREANLRQGETIWRRQGSLLALKWKDKWEVTILTSCHGPTVERVHTRHGDKIKPSCVKKYTQCMGGVNLSDQLLAYMPFQRKNVKWWKKLFFHLHLLLIVNAHILYNQYRLSRRLQKWDLETFIKEVAQGIIHVITRKLLHANYYTKTYGQKYLD